MDKKQRKRTRLKERAEIKRKLETEGRRQIRPYSPEIHNALCKLEFMIEDKKYFRGNILRYILNDPSKKEADRFFYIYDPHGFPCQWGCKIDGNPQCVPFEYVFENSSEEIQAQLIWHLNIFVGSK